MNSPSHHNIYRIPRLLNLWLQSGTKLLMTLPASCSSIFKKSSTCVVLRRRGGVWGPSDDWYYADNNDNLLFSSLTFSSLKSQIYYFQFPMKHRRDRFLCEQSKAESVRDRYYIKPWWTLSFPSILRAFWKPLVPNEESNWLMIIRDHAYRSRWDYHLQMY